MLVTGPFIKLDKQERIDIAQFCFDVLSAGTRQSASIVIKRREDRFEAARELVLAMMTKTDLWSARFFDVAEHADDYRQFFGVQVPAWFANPAERSPSREQFRGIVGEDAKHRIRRYLNCQAIVAAAEASGVKLGDLGLRVPDEVWEAEAAVDQWRAMEAVRSKRRRAVKKEHREEAEAAAAAIPSDEEVLRQRIVELEQESRAKDETIRKLKAQADSRPQYREAQREAASVAIETAMYDELAKMTRRAERAEAHLDIARKRKAPAHGFTGYRTDPISYADQVVADLVRERQLKRWHS